MNSNERQVGGSHYQSAVQHWDFVAANRLSYLGGQVTKYITRWSKKNGLEDIEKAMHFLEKQIEVATTPPAPVTIEDFMRANPHLGAYECEILRLVAEFERTGEVEFLMRARVFMYRLKESAT